MNDFFAFRRMITPFILQVFFVLASAIAMFGGVLLLLLGVDHHITAKALGGVALILLGPLFARIIAEVLIVTFRIYARLSELRDLGVWAAERAYATDYARDAA
jgi:hypothetical protein